MKTFFKKDIVLVSFPFSNLSGNKIRPTIILGEDQQDITCVFITTVKPEYNFLEIKRDEKNNIKQNSYIRYSKMASLDKKLIIGKLGTLSDYDYKELLKRITDFVN